MANSDKSSRRGLKAYSYTDSAETRADNENAKRPEGANYEWVIYNIEIFPIHVNLVKAYNQSDNHIKKRQYKLWKKQARKDRLKANPLSPKNRGYAQAKDGEKPNNPYKKGSSQYMSYLVGHLMGTKELMEEEKAATETIIDPKERRKPATTKPKKDGGTKE